MVSGLLAALRKEPCNFLLGVNQRSVVGEGPSAKREVCSCHHVLACPDEFPHFKAWQHQRVLENFGKGQGLQQVLASFQVRTCFCKRILGNICGNICSEVWSNLALKPIHKLFPSSSPLAPITSIYFIFKDDSLLKIKCSIWAASSMCQEEISHPKLWWPTRVPSRDSNYCLHSPY